MEENLSPDQRNAILKRRQEMLKGMGVKNAGKMMNESVIATNPANAGIAQKIAAIRSGAAKQELNQYINATTKGSNANGFQLPEPKMKKNPNPQEVDPKYKQELENFSGPSTANSHELSAIESMFGGDSPRAMMPTAAPAAGHAYMQPPVQTDLSIDNIMMPSFNPQMAAQKMREKAQAKSQSQYLKYASDTAPVGSEEFEEINPGMAQGVNLAAMQMMMETIAKGIAEKTIRNVLDEYSQQQKSKVYFEYYNKEKGIIKTQDGKYYRLTQVELKKKS